MQTSPGTRFGSRACRLPGARARGTDSSHRGRAGSQGLPRVPARWLWWLRSPWRRPFNHFFVCQSCCHSSDPTWAWERCGWEGGSQWYPRAESHQVGRGGGGFSALGKHTSPGTHAESPNLFFFANLPFTRIVPAVSFLSTTFFSLCTLAARLGNYSLNLTYKFVPCCLCS